MIGLGTALIRGNTCVLRRKFSATNFWQDCIDHNCTVSDFFIINSNHSINLIK
jgi:solute carrier family 27 fatty acid transporter 1/4